MTTQLSTSRSRSTPALPAGMPLRNAWFALVRILGGACIATVSLWPAASARADDPAPPTAATSTAARASGTAAATAPVLVTAKLVDIPTKFPPDDLYDYAYVMRYQVADGGPLDKQFILVAHYKPRQPRAKIADAMKGHVSGKVRSFKTGDTHKLQLTPDLKKIWKGALLDEFAATDRKSVRYWALTADPA